MKKTYTTYSNKDFSITVSEGASEEYISVHEYQEPCSGILKHWGTRKELIKELESVIKAIKELK